MHLHAGALGLAQHARDLARQAPEQAQAVHRRGPAPLGQHPGRVARPHRRLQQRLGLGGHVEVGRQRAPQPLQRDEGLDQQRQIGRQRQPVLAQDGGDIVHHPAQAELGQRGAAVLVDEGDHILLQRLHVGVAGILGPLHQHLDHRLGIALHQAEHQRQQLVAARIAEPAHHAEIDEGQPVARQVEDIARMRIGVEEAVLDDHLQHRLRAALRQQHAVEPGGVHPRQLMAGNAVDALLHIDPLAGPVPVDGRDDDVLAPGEMGGDTLGVVALALQVQLAAQRAPELAHQAGRLVGAQVGPLVLGQLRQALEQAQIGLDDRADAGPAHLDDDLGAVVQLRAVHLRDRGRRQRLGIEAGEDLLGRRAQVLGELGAHHLDRHRRRLTVQLFEFGDPGRAEQVGAAGQDLAELDEGRPQILERHAQLHRRIQPRQVGGMVHAQHMAGAGQPIGPAEPAHQIAQAVADEDRRDLLQPAEIAGCRQGGKCHGRGDQRPPRRDQR